MMFQTIGLNTGNVRLETLIFGLCWAIDAVAEMSATAQAVASTTAQAVASTARPRRNDVTIKLFLPFLRLERKLVLAAS
jgi:hypothetical protein